MCGSLRIPLKKTHRESSVGRNVFANMTYTPCMPKINECGVGCLRVVEGEGMGLGEYHNLCVSAI